MSVDPKQLCLQLLQADNENKVVDILKMAGYWDDSTAWRLYGDKEGNYSVAGGQQAAPDTALVEKIVNSVDSFLMSHCLTLGIGLESPEAPNDIREAVATFFHNSKDKNMGFLKEWSQEKIREHARNITLAATGDKEETCISIADIGEGQSPNRLPDTILSLNKKNKQRIKFVQGKFNMGGTGALRHCGDHGLQLVISRRNPELIGRSDNDMSDDSSNFWGFTVVRRVAPTGNPGEVVHSEFKYLAPINENVLRFEADELPLMPVKNKAYDKNVTWGTLIKLYKYDMTAGRSNVLMRNGLLRRLELLLPEIAPPVRIHECRPRYRGSSGSYDSSLSGLVPRIESERDNNLVRAPWNIPFQVHDHNFFARVYIFQSGKAKTYTDSSTGIIFTINGQTHGAITRKFFERKTVGLSRIGKDLLIMIDCSDIDVVGREDLFMTTRDKLSEGKLRKAIEKQLEEILKRDEYLRKIQEERRMEEQDHLLKDDKPLEDVLNTIVSSSPSLLSILGSGARISMPATKNNNTENNTMAGNKGENGGSGTNKPTSIFHGKRHPEFFRFRKKPKGNCLARTCEKGRMVRVGFETDVENSYFMRSDNKGKYSAKIKDSYTSITGHSINLRDGDAFWSIDLPDTIDTGSTIEIELKVYDDIIDPIVNILKLTVVEKTERRGGSRVKRERKKGSGSAGDDEVPRVDGGLDMPEMRRVYKNQPKYTELEFDDYSACSFYDDPGEYIFYINIDNKFLQREKRLSKEPDVIEKRFIYANTLIGMALIHYHDNNNRRSNHSNSSDKDEVSAKDLVEKTTAAVSPCILPIINQLGLLTNDDASGAIVADDPD